MNTITYENKESVFNHPRFILGIIILILLNNIEHTAVLYHSISINIFPYAWLNWTHAIVVNLVLDAAILIFVIKGKHLEAGLYSAFLALLNLIYYKGLGLLPQAVLQNLTSFCYSLMFPYSLYVFSKFYFEGRTNNNTASYLTQQIKELEAKNHTQERLLYGLNQQESEQKNILTELHVKNHTLVKENQLLNDFKKSRIKELTCPDCGFKAENDYGVAGHRKKCQEK